MRSPTMRRIGVSGTGFCPAVAAVGCGTFPDAARSTSSAKILPSGPLPLRVAISISCSRAMRFAAGDASSRPPLGTVETGVGVKFAAGADFFAGVATRFGVADFVAAGSDSPGSKIIAIRCPTGTSSPAWAITWVNMPEVGASISTVALSVSISISGSPLVTDWPSVLSHLSSVPVCWATPSAGMITLVGMVCCLLRQSVRGDRPVAPTKCLVSCAYRLIRSRAPGLLRFDCVSRVVDNSPPLVK